MGIIGKMQKLKYRLNMRQAMQKSSIEELHICLEECRNEINRRNKKNGKT